MASCSPQAVFNSCPLSLSCCCPSGDALLDAGESMKRLAEVKDSLDIEVKQNFIDPLQNLCDKDLKEIQVSTPCFSAHLPLSGLWGCWCMELPAAGSQGLAGIPCSLSSLPPDSLLFPPCSALLLLLLSSPKGCMQVGMVLHLPCLMGVHPSTPSGLAELDS